jgi:hypothetical protein
MASKKDIQYCSLCKSHLQGNKEARFPGPSGKTVVVNLEEKGEGICTLCENNVCNKMFYTSLCQEIQRLKREKKSNGERKELEELEQELSKLSVQPVPLTMRKRRVSDELAEMEKQVEEEEEFKKLERRAEKEVKAEKIKSSRKSPPKREKSPKKSLFKKLFGKN